MIITIRGIITEKGADHVIVETAGVGYQVFLHASALADAKKGAQAAFWTHEHIREDIRDLFGFLTREEYDLFRKLLGVSGVGPRVASAILSIGKVGAVQDMITKGDVTGLTRVPGLGKKTAQKIVLELQGKLVDAEGVADGSEEVVSALMGLGYSREKARDVLARVPAKDGETVEERLRDALRAMGR